MGFAHILSLSLPYVSLSKHFSFLNFHWFINLSLFCLLVSAFPLLSLLAFPFPQSHTFFPQALCHFFLINSISTFSWAVRRGQLVGRNYPCCTQMRAGLKLLEPLQPLHLPDTPRLWKRRRPAHGSWLITGSSKGELQLSFLFRKALRLPSFPKETSKVQLEPELLCWIKVSSAVL